MPSSRSVEMSGKVGEQQKSRRAKNGRREPASIFLNTLFCLLPRPLPEHVKMSNVKMCSVWGQGFARVRKPNFRIKLHLIPAWKAFFLRFCKKNVTCLETKVPGVSLFNVIRNKELVSCYTGDKYFVLADVVGSLVIGFDLGWNEKLSNYSCLTCAQRLARIYRTFKKIIAQANEGIVGVPGKRMSSNSLTGVSPLAKRTRGLEHVATSLKTSSPRRLLDFPVEPAQAYHIE